MTEEKARESTKCLGCGETKEFGLVVCWDCFKYRNDAFKYSKKSLDNWLKSLQI